ncbi:hypothetical protein [Komagataeibacter diospyri]|uniref:Uncharacterized protein n=1 Tax=Komagataeibacter diospyri TaxID=1932662 RepID=A0A4P5NNL4_9PROT|nr:hypothetical protein [Komagataeibacter diospyri]GCE82973.1 hypothetical protein MSKU9_1114 [Komagataeibacter diospyri]GCE89788.1 hypothetical protein MSKU15_1389 [Komagataeibacter diospyri]
MSVRRKEPPPERVTFRVSRQDARTAWLATRGGAEALHAHRTARPASGPDMDDSLSGQITGCPATVRAPVALHGARTKTPPVQAGRVQDRVFNGK